MPGDRYVYEGLEAFEKRLRRVAADVDYLVVWDRTERRNEDPLGRFALTLGDALPYLEQAEELVDIDEADPDADFEDHLFDPDDDPVDEDTEEAETDDARVERLLGRAPGPADFAVAASRWLRDVGDEALERADEAVPVGPREDRLDELAKDPDHGGNSTPGTRREAEVALAQTKAAILLMVLGYNGIARPLEAAIFFRPTFNSGLWRRGGPLRFSMRIEQ